jgi:hypothetical protein
MPCPLSCPGFIFQDQNTHGLDCALYALLNFMKMKSNQTTIHDSFETPIDIDASYGRGAQENRRRMLMIAVRSPGHSDLSRRIYIHRCYR